MKTTADWLSHIRKANDYGIDSDGDVQPNIERLMARKARIIPGQIKGIENLLQHNHISNIKGMATITAPGHISVIRSDGEIQGVEWDRLIIAAGKWISRQLRRRSG